MALLAVGAAALAGYLPQLLHLWLRAGQWPLAFHVRLVAGNGQIIKTLIDWTAPSWP